MSVILLLTLWLVPGAGAEASASGQAAAPPQMPASANQSPGAAPTPATPSADPASSQFTGDTGILLVTIKPTAVADYEEVIRTLQKALASDTDPARKSATRGWRVFRAAEADAKGNPIFIHLIAPATPNFDYRPSLLLDELVSDLAPELLIKYQDAFAAPPTKLNLVEFASMAVMPVEAPVTKKPGQ